MRDSLGEIVRQTKREYGVNKQQIIFIIFFFKSTKYKIKARSKGVKE